VRSSQTPTLRDDAVSATEGTVGVSGWPTDTGTAAEYKLARFTPEARMVWCLRERWWPGAKVAPEPKKIRSAVELVNTQ
jgi:hypothetical protein